MCLQYFFSLSLSVTSLKLLLMADVFTNHQEFLTTRGGYTVQQNHKDLYVLCP